MSRSKGGSGGAIGAGALLDLIRERPRTRAELLEDTGLARSTLSLRLDLLIGHGLVRVGDVIPSTGGRPASVLTFDASAGAVLVADVGHTHAHMAVTDLGNEVLAEQVDEIDIATGPEATLQRLVEAFDGLLAEAGRTRADVRAAALGMPGPVEFAAGRIVHPTAMPGWDGFPVADALHAALRCPVLVDNDANVMAVGEHAAGWRSVPDLVFLKMGTGLGAGLITDGRLYRGAQGAAGDIGHVQVPGYDHVVCVCGNRGCIGMIAAGAGLAMQLVDLGVPTAGAQEVVAHVRNGVPEALRLVRDGGRAVGSVLAGVVNLLNPSLIVIGGVLAEAGEHLLAGIREGVYGRSTALATRDLRIATSAAGGRAGILGASVMAVDHVLAPETVDAMVASAAPPSRASA